MSKKSTHLQHFFSQSALNLFGNAVASFLSFLFNYLVVKKISTAHYGEYSSAMAYVTLLTLPLTVVSLLVTKKISRQRTSVRIAYLRQLNARLLATLRHYWGVVIAVLVGVGGGLAAAANFLDPWTSILVVVLLVLTSLTTFLAAELTGLQWFATLSLSSIGSMLARLLIGWGGLARSASLASLYWCLLLANLAQVGIHLVALRRRCGQSLMASRPVTPRPHSWWRQRDFYLTLMATLITTGLLNLDVVTVKLLAPPALAGQYSLLSLFAKILLYASQPLINVAFTFFNASRQPRARQRILFVSLILITLFTTVMALLYWRWPALLITLVGHESYLGLASALWLSAVYGGVYSLVMLLVQSLLARESSFIKFGLLAPLAQVGIISVYHASPAQVMSVNIVVAGVLLVVLLVKNFWPDA